MRSKTLGTYREKCKDCHNTYVREVWYPKNKDKQLASSKRWKDVNPDKVVATKYGCSIDEARQLLSASRCEICDKEEDLVVDHDHNTGRLRGRLCKSCNTGLGMFGERVESFQRAIGYLTKYGV